MGRKFFFFYLGLPKSILCVSIDELQDNIYINQLIRFVIYFTLQTYTHDVDNYKDSVIKKYP